MNEEEPKDRGEFAVFEVYGKTLHYSKSSLFIFGQDNSLRVRVVKVVAHPWFDRFILFLILVNSVVLALTDWSVIDEDPASSTVGEPSQAGSWRNKLLYRSEPVFTAFFTMEFVLKVIAEGFCLGQGSYLRNAWNVLDFIVVVTALLSTIPEVPPMSAIRVFRVLRPLRSVSALPGLQSLVLAMLNSVPQLVSVVIVLAFIFTVFGIFGVQIFGGKQHARCRLTPYPVNNTFEIGMNYTEYRCLNVSNFDVEDDEPSWTQNSSPWSTPRECWWPLDSEDERLCTVDRYGKHKCLHDPEYMNETEFRWCGSNYDALGNPRFAGGVIEGVEWSAKELTANATYIESLNWGYTTFDNIFSAILSIFQAITLEGWSEILYQVKDCSLPILADLFFIVLILWGSFFTLNLLLAVLEANFTKGKEGDKENEEARRHQMTPNSNEDPNGSAVPEAKVEVGDSHFWGTLEDRPNGGEFSEAKLDGGTGGRAMSRIEEEDEAGKSSNGSGGGDSEYLPPWRLALRRLVESAYFQQLITALIIINTMTLAIDHHPLDDEVGTYLEAFNFAFTLCFMIEMVLKLVALGPRGYAEDRFNLFDGLIVISSLVELILSPPSFLAKESGDDSDAGGGISALRTFRVLRVFKLARSWKSMRELLSTISRTIVDVGNFGLLLLLFMFIYSLIGLQFFANRFHFDEDGDVVGIGREGYDDAYVPRSNFDTLLNAFTTIFVILSGDSWNAVMYDARRATGLVSVLYFVSLIVLGMMIIMTLFLAILLSNFGDETNNAEEKEGARTDEGSRDGDSTEDGKGQRHDNGAEPDRTQRPSIVAVGNTSQEGPFISSSQTASEEGLEGVGRSAPRVDSELPKQDAADGGGKRGDDDNGDGDNAANNPRAEDAVRYGRRLRQVGRKRRDGDDGESERGGDTATVADEKLAVKYRRWLREARAGLARCAKSAIRSVKVPDNLDPGRSLFIFGPTNPVRQGCAAVVTNPVFDKVVLILIATSSISLALDNPLLDPDSTMAIVLGDLEVIITMLFVTEMVLKVCADGFLFMPGAYLRNWWNGLDFLVVVVSVFQLFSGSSGGLQSLKSLRALRALRPLRIINRAPGLKLVLSSLFAAIPDVLNVTAVCFMFFLIFAILGVTYFKGILMSCQGDGFDALPQAVMSFIESPIPWSEMSDQQREWFSPSSNISEAYEVEFASQCAVINSGWPDSAACCPDWPLSSSEAPTSFQVCDCLGLDWDETIPQQFNNVGLALLTFFEMSTISGWSSVTYAAVDATDVDMQPIRDQFPNRVWFFMLFILFGSYLVMNLFVGVIIDNFKEMKSKAEESGMMTEEQLSWMKTQLIMTRLRPLKRLNPPKNRLGKWCYRLSRHKWFELVVMTCIVLNTVVMAMQYFGQGETYTRFTELVNITLYTVFLLEAVVKLLGLRRAYFTDPWNRFDFFIVIGSTLGLLMVWFTGSMYGSIAMIVRIFRIGRVLRLVRGMESMAQLFETLLVTLPSLGNVGALLFLMFFIYAVMGVQLFAKVGFEGTVDDRANFQTFWGSMVLLLRLSTGDSWNFFMYDMAAEREGCVTDPDYDPDMCGFSDRPNCVPLNGCGSWAIFPYMITFTLTIGYVFMNLFIGVILDGFDEASKENSEIIKQEDFARFARNWEEFDPRATCLISDHDLPKFLQTLFEPWGFGDHEVTDREMRNKIERLALRVTSNNQVHFQDVLVALSREVHRALAEKKGAQIDLSESYKMGKKNIRMTFAEEKEYIFNPYSKRDITLEQILAAEYIQRAYRRKREWERRKRDQGEGMAWGSYQRRPRVTESPKEPDTRGNSSMKVDGLLAAEEGMRQSGVVRGTYLLQGGEVGSSAIHRTNNDIRLDPTDAGGDVAGGSAEGSLRFPRLGSSLSGRRASGARQIFNNR